MLRSVARRCLPCCGGEGAGDEGEAEAFCKVVDVDGGGGGGAGDEWKKRPAPPAGAAQATGVPVVPVAGEVVVAAPASVTLAINGVAHEVAAEDLSAGLTLAAYLRGPSCGLMGTKLSCKEGGCGACTVTKESLDPATGKWVPAAINACLAPLVGLNGCKITTIEGIGSKDSPHAIQKALADANGSQCGFCSPGMCMNMYTLLKEKEAAGAAAPTPEEVERRFDGNICRCTGYRPILDAMQAVAKKAGGERAQATAPAAGCCGGHGGGDIEDLGGCAHPSCDGAGDASTPTTSPRPGAAALARKKKVNACVRRATKAACSDCLDRRLQSASSASSAAKGAVVLHSASGDDGLSWALPTSLEDLLALMRGNAGKYELVASNTGNIGVKPYYNQEAWGGAAPAPALSIDISQVPDLNYMQESPNGLEFGANTSLERLRAALEASSSGEKALCSALASHLGEVANVQVRSVGTVGGNLGLGWTFQRFPSDLLTIFAAVGARVTLVDPQTKQASEAAVEAVQSIDSRVLKSVVLPFGVQPGTAFFFKTHKVMLRHQNAHAVVNAGFQVRASEDTQEISSARIFYGGVTGEGLSRAAATEALLIGKKFTDRAVLAQALQTLAGEVCPAAGDRQHDYKQNLVQTLFYKFFLSMQPSLDPALASAVQDYIRPVSGGSVEMEGAEDPDEFPVSSPMEKRAALGNCTGETMFAGDLPALHGTLACAFVLSREACCDTFALDYGEAEKCPGFVASLDAAQLSQRGLGNAVSPTEELFAAAKISYAGQRLAMVIADSQRHADQAARRVAVTYGGKRTPVLTLEDAIARESFYNAKPETYQQGDGAAASLDDSPVKVKGMAEVGHQHHFHMEVQTARSYLTSDGLKVDVATQAPGIVADAVAASLGLRKASVEVKTMQAGGAYGGKTSKSIPCAVASALAAHVTGAPCAVRLDLRDNLRSLGSRRPHRFEYEVGCDPSGKINAVKGTLYFLQGAYLDRADTGGLNAIYLSVDGCYNIANWGLRGFECLTNTPGNTFCRGPIFLPGTFIIEQIIDAVAAAVAMQPEDVRFLNLYKPGDTALCGQKLVDSNINKCWDLVLSKCDFNSRVADAEAFNAKNTFLKKGIALVPGKYIMNGCRNYPAFVEILEDGAVLVQHAGCEIGQGIHTKAIQAAALELAIDPAIVQCSATTSRLSPSACPTEGSTTSEAICASTILCCRELASRMQPVRAKLPADASWPKVVAACYAQSVDLHAFCVYDGSQKDPGVLPDGQDNGPAPYVGYGAAVVECQVDVLTGETQILRCDLVQDTGISLNPAIDVGQIQGSFVMGLGYLLTEEHFWDVSGDISGGEGNQLACGTWEYKPPSSLDIPVTFNVTLLPMSPNRHGVLGSKAVGEPPLILSVCAVAAIRKAIQAFRNHQGTTTSTSTIISSSSGGGRGGGAGGSEEDGGGFVELRAPCTVARVQVAAGVDPKQLSF